MYRIREEYKNKFIICAKSRSKVDLSTLDERKYEYYYNQGLTYIFEKIEDEPCKCGEGCSEGCVKKKRRTKKVKYKGDKKNLNLGDINEEV